MKISLVILAAMLFLSCRVELNTPTYTQTKVVQYGSLSGVVELSDGGFAAGASIKLIHRSNCFMCGWPGEDTLIDQTTTDSIGTFHFEDVEARSYIIHIGEVEGYFTLGDFLAYVSPNQESNVRYVLSPDVNW